MIKPFLSVVIPCYNERENLERGVLGEVAEYLDERQADLYAEVVSNLMESDLDKAWRDVKVEVLDGVFEEYALSRELSEMERHLS